MLHLVPEFAPDFEPKTYPEPIARLASLRNALRVVDEFGGGPASGPGNPRNCDVLKS